MGSLCKKILKYGLVAFGTYAGIKLYSIGKAIVRVSKTLPEFVKNLYKQCSVNNACKIFYAKEVNGNIIAANFLVYDDTTVYYLMGGIDPTKKDLGGMDMILHESVKFALESGRRFDFEGSMLESVEKYFRSYGSQQKPYYNISKVNSKALKLQIALKDMIKAIVR